MQVDVVGAEVVLGSTVVFSDLTRCFPARQVTALVGPSGSGKSTLLAVLAGHQPLRSGRVELREFPFSAPSPPDPMRVAWVPQGSNALGRRSVLDNVMVAPLSTGVTLAEARERAMAALGTVRLAHCVDQQARRLSGGELQRTALARALASGKELILADEPSANLDATSTELMAEILDSLRSSATIVVATHDPLLVDAAQSSVMMRPAARRGSTVPDLQRGTVGAQLPHPGSMRTSVTLRPAGAPVDGEPSP